MIFRCGDVIYAGVGADWITLPQFFRVQSEPKYTVVGTGKVFHKGLPPNWDLNHSWDPRMSNGTWEDWMYAHDSFALPPSPSRPFHPLRFLFLFWLSRGHAIGRTPAVPAMSPLRSRQQATSSIQCMLTCVILVTHHNLSRYPAEPHCVNSTVWCAVTNESAIYDDTHITQSALKLLRNITQLEPPWFLAVGYVHEHDNSASSSYPLSCFVLLLLLFIIILFYFI